MKLTNKSEIQRVGLALNKKVRREHSLRLFLDINSNYGTNRKELIIQMYETLLANGFIDEDLMLKRKAIVNLDDVDDIIKRNEKSFENSMKEEGQRKAEDVDVSDFSGI